jgi:predicted HTH transcriptional regulator
MGAIPTSDMPGHRQLHDRVCSALDRCQESQAIDFKESAPWKSLKWRLIRTTLAMGNLRDGGVIIIGASERGNNWELTGIAQEHLTTYDVDDTTDAINKYASPPMQIEMVRVKYQEDREFLAFQIREFEYAPYVCRNNSPNKTGLLHEGDVYIRPPGKPQTKKVTNVQEMHDLLELAAEKYARSMIRTSRSIGLVSAQDNTRHFDKELEGL